MLNPATVMDGVFAIDDVTVMIPSVLLYPVLMLLLIVDTDKPWSVLTTEAVRILKL